MNQLSFGAPPGVGPGDACGRCFALTADHDPYAPDYTGPFGQSIIVKVTDACPVAGNEVWCGQTATDDVNQFGQPFQSVFTHSFVSHGCTDLDYTSFDLCVDSGAAAPFFPDGMNAHPFH